MKTSDLQNNAEFVNPLKVHHEDRPMGAIFSSQSFLADPALGHKLTQKIISTFIHRPFQGFIESSKNIIVFCFELGCQRMRRRIMTRVVGSLRSLADSFPGMVWVTDCNGVPEYYNKQFINYTGLNIGEKSFLNEVIHPEDLELVKKEWKKARAGGLPFHLEYRLKRKFDDSYRWNSSFGTPFFGLLTDVTKWIGTNTDIHDQKIGELALKSKQHQLDSALEASNLGTWSLDVAKNQWSLSPKALEIFDLNSNMVITSELIENQIHPDDLARMNRVWAAALANHQPYNCEYRVIGVNKDVRWVSSRGCVTNNLEGAGISYNGVIADITDRKNFEVALRSAKEESDRANQLKTAFLANMSHEIRTPLGAMLGFAELLQDSELTEIERKDYISILTKNGQQLGLIINDILDLSKVEAGHLSFEWEKVSPGKIALEVASLLHVIADVKNISLDVIVESSAPADLVTDPGRLRQILSNIIGNAIKFTSKGHISIRISSGRSPDGKKTIEFAVSDTGIGISQASQDKLFKIFSQGDDTITRHYGGTGLGLTLSLKLAERLGGNVTLLKSELGKGSTFIVTIQNQLIDILEPDPLSRRKEFLVKESLPPGRLENKSVLVVEDSTDNQHLIRKILNKNGITVEIANNGSEGLEKALKGSYDLIIMDLQMPVMDGYTATKNLRANGYHKPIVALTAHAMSEVRNQALEAGFTDYLPKPINSQDLIKMISEHC